MSGDTIIVQATTVAIDGRALAIEGPSGSGKSTLALALIDRGAQLIGDDGVTLRRVENRIMASRPPNIGGVIEVHGVGLFDTPIGDPAPLSLIIDLGEPGERLPDTLPVNHYLGVAIPRLAFAPGTIAPALRAERALEKHGLSKD
ncbi:MAG: HPr kinase/phosphatase C-terminal domain-containing protein [Erythrobacter sp.]